MITLEVRPNCEQLDQHANNLVWAYIPKAQLPAFSKLKYILIRRNL